MKENPRASVPPAAVADPQPSDRGSGVPGVPPSWAPILALYATPELLLLDVLRIFADPYANVPRLQDPLAPTLVLRLLTDGHPVRRA